MIIWRLNLLFQGRPLLGALPIAYGLAKKNVATGSIVKVSQNRYMSVIIQRSILSIDLPPVCSGTNILMRHSLIHYQIHCS